ncbi:MAG: phospholipase D-like domain-containing protein, partial [Patescibacteria group bacterium]|nr:phospholipase D-like domain-containing protein [Patescibacteria group bacterium]
MENYKLFTKNKELYSAMLADITQAEKFIYLETYIYGNDKIGEQFRDLLIKKARTGVRVKIIIDDFGSEVKENFFSELIKAGGQIKFFRKFIYSIKLVSKNNSRNHRKLLTIDNKIIYLGSSNIKEKHLDWHELNIRIKNGIAEYFSSIFLDNFKIANKKSFIKKRHISPIRSGLFEIIRDVPSIKFNKIRKRKIELIKQAKKQV